MEGHEIGEFCQVDEKIDFNTAKLIAMQKAEMLLIIHRTRPIPGRLIWKLRKTVNTALSCRASVQKQPYPFMNWMKMEIRRKKRSAAVPVQVQIRVHSTMEALFHLKREKTFQLQALNWKPERDI